MSTVETARLPLITGGLAELQRRMAMERGDLAPPPDTTREQRQIVLHRRALSENDDKLRAKRKHKQSGQEREKEELQGTLMRELDRLQFLLPRPIPSVNADGKFASHDKDNPVWAPVWVHTRYTFPERAHRDITNYWWHAKPWGDAFTGPFYTGTGANRRPANRRLWVGGRLYVGGWLAQDTDHYWSPTMDLDTQPGPAAITVTLVWDQPAD